MRAARPRETHASSPRRRHARKPVAARLPTAAVWAGSEALDDVHEKMREYASSEARLGWLIDPESRRVWVYEGQAEPVCLEQPESVSGGDVLPGFALEMGGIW